jgi:L-lactate dehydrogenase complex protein LldF
MKKYADLPFASTLCGSCTNVCPVKIDIHDQLYKWRQVIVQKGYVKPAKKAGIKGMSLLLSSPFIFTTAGAVGRWVMRYLPFVVNNPLNPWYKQRNMPEAPAQSFREWYAKNRKNG